MTIQDITTFSELQEIAPTKKYTVIDFYADWCGPCKKLKPLFLEWSQNVSIEVHSCTLRHLFLDKA